MNTQTQNCQPDRLELFLNGDLDRVQELQLTEHLESCGFCRQSLESTAAEPNSWLEASQLLKPTRFDWNPGGEPDASDCSELLSPIPLQIRNVLDSLTPSEDPKMLGQLGGYQVTGVVGAGAMGVVLKAADKSLDRTVAIKVLSPHLASSGAARKRFAREAKAAAAVLHPNVIAIHGVSNDQTMPHLVMPYVRGTSLQKRINNDGSLPVNEILRIGAQVAAGLAAAHAQGLVHRDIKPANILLEEGVERVAITDFGLARAVDDASLTRTGIIAGTPQYMSPEQSRGESVDQRSDLFSLGSVMYAMCAGRPPFRCETTYGVIQRINNDQPTPIREINPDVPDWLAQILERLMSKQAENRYESAQEVSDLLEQCLAHIQQPATTPLPTSCVTRPRSSVFLSGSRRRTGITTMMIACAFGLLGMFLWQATDPPDITGKWYGDGWGEVELDHQAFGQYTGGYSDTFGDQPGTMELKWSRIERRFNGKWQEGKKRFGEVSLRHADDRIFGAWTSSAKSQIHPGQPVLGDLQWTRPPANLVESGARAPLTIDVHDQQSAKTIHKLKELGIAEHNRQVQEVELDVDPTKPSRMILHYCDADGMPIRPLLKDAELRRALDRQGTPDVSADGKNVVFDAWSTVDPKWGTGQIVVCDIDGSNAHVICDGFMPSYSPDGKQMVISRMPKYTKADGVEGQSIWIVRSDGSMKRMVAEHGAWGARWSSDGKSLVFFGGVDEKGEKVSKNCLRLYDINTKRIKNVFSPNDSPFKKLGFHFEWAKNERSVAFSGIKKGKARYMSATINVDKGLDSLRLFDNPVVYHRLCYDYHPDGESLLVTGNDSGRTVPVSLALTDEGTTRILPNVPANVKVRDTCYTPDGNHIIAALGRFGRAVLPEKIQSRHQTPYGTGKVIAFTSKESEQTVQAPAKGIVSKIADGLEEGKLVKKGEVLFEIQPLAGDWLQQLEAQLASYKAIEKNAKAKAEAYGQQVTALTEEMGFALAAAEALVSSTKVKLQSKQSQVSAYRAKEVQAKLNYQRQESLWKKGLKRKDEVDEFKKEWDVASADCKSAQLDVSSLEHELVAKQNELKEKKSLGQTKLDKAIAKQQNAQGQLSVARKVIGKLLTKQQESKRLLIIAPQDGIVHRLNVHGRGDVVIEGDPLLTVVPEATRKAVELFVAATEMPLVQKGQKVRLEFEGWPSVLGVEFLGTVATVEATANGKGQIRILVAPNEDGGSEWPEDRHLRPGVRANGWVIPRPLNNQINHSNPKKHSAPPMEKTPNSNDSPVHQQIQEVNYRGTCVRDDDGRPIANAMVRLFLYRKSDSEFVLAKIAHTNERGFFSIRGSVPEEFDLTASRVAISSPGRATSVLFYQDTKKSAPARILSAPASVTGEVTDFESKPIDGATVIHGRLPGVWQARTDSDGRFEISDVPPAEELNWGRFNILMAVHPELKTLTTTTIKSVPTNVKIQLRNIPIVPSPLARAAQDALTFERGAPAAITAPVENLFFDEKVPENVAAALKKLSGQLSMQEAFDLHGRHVETAVIWAAHPAEKRGGGARLQLVVFEDGVVFANGPPAWRGELSKDEMQELMKFIRDDQKFAKIHSNPESPKVALEKSLLNIPLAQKLALDPSQTLHESIQVGSMDFKVQPIHSESESGELTDLHPSKNFKRITRRLRRIKGTTAIGGRDELKSYLDIANRELQKQFPNARPLTLDDEFGVVVVKTGKSENPWDSRWLDFWHLEPGCFVQIEHIAKEEPEIRNLSYFGSSKSD